MTKYKIEYRSADGNVFVDEEIFNFMSVAALAAEFTIYKRTIKGEYDCAYKILSVEEPQDTIDCARKAHADLDCAARSVVSRDVLSKIRNIQDEISELILQME